MDVSHNGKDGEPVTCPVAVRACFLTHHWGWIGLLAVAGAIGLFHRPLLTAIGGGLVLSRPLPAPDCLFVYGNEFHVNGENALDVAAEMYRQSPDLKILAVDRDPNSCVREGVVPSFAKMVRRELVNRGLPPAAMIQLPGEAIDDRHAIGLLGKWLKENREARVLILTDRFASRIAAVDIDAAIDESERARCGVEPLPAVDVDEANWWRLRAGAKEIAREYLRLVFALSRGPAQAAPRPSCDAYERAFLETLGGLPQ